MIYYEFGREIIFFFSAQVYVLIAPMWTNNIQEK